MKALNTTPRIGRDPSLNRELMEHATLVNALSDGRIAATTARNAPPTLGSYTHGDFVRNSEPMEAGSAGSKYVVYGWLCVSSGTPGTFVEARFLTGN